MAIRTESIRAFKTILICDECLKETELCTTHQLMGYEEKVNGALSKGYQFDGQGKKFTIYCHECIDKKQ